MVSIFPVLTYPDPRAAIDWLCAAYGLTEHAVHLDESGTVVHAELAHGDGLLLIGRRTSPRPRPDDTDWSVYLVVDDIDRHCERARSVGAEIVREPHDTDYGSRDYAARDLDGNVWSFGTYRPGPSASS